MSKWNFVFDLGVPTLDLASMDNFIMLTILINLIKYVDLLWSLFLIEPPHIILHMSDMW